MPLNPMTGQYEYGGNSYDIPTMGISSAQPEAPFFLRVMENIPAVSTSALFSARRFANTMERGGYRDVLNVADLRKRGKVTQIRRAAQRRKALRAGAFLPDATTGAPVATTSYRRFLFGARRDLTGKTPFLKQSLGTNNFLNPKNWFRNPSLAHLSGVAGGSAYTPYQGASMIDHMLAKTKFAKGQRAALGISDDTPLLSGGVFGRLTTMGRVYHAEMKAARGTELLSRGGRISKFRGNRMIKSAEEVKTGIGTSLEALGQPMTGTSLNSRIAGTAAGRLTTGFLQDTATIVNADLMTKAASFSVTHAPESVARLEGLFTKAFGGSATAAADAMANLGSTVVRQGATAALREGEFKVAAKLGSRYVGAQFVKASGPLNIIGTAAFAYDLGKMAATGIVSAGNFAKEAVKSMQGSMRKPLFGMGYQDNEVAATSRSRGVMAIQNSRLNARSMLGSEAGMMAAHFG